MATVTASDSGKSIMEDATVKITVNNLLHIRPKETVLLGKALIIDLFKSLKMILNTLVVLGVLRFSGAIYGRGVWHGLISPGIG